MTGKAQQIKLSSSIAVMVALLLSTDCLANQIPTPSMALRGVYVGAELGKGWNRTSAEFLNPNYFNTINSTIVGNHFNFHSNGIVGGAHVGIDYQARSIVLGAQASVLGADLSTKMVSPFFPTLDTYSFALHLMSTVKARLGYAYERWLPYVTGGWAGGNVAMTLKSATDGVRASSSQWTNGWIAGAGLDYRVSDNLSLGVAYDFMQLNLNTKTITCSSCGTGEGLGTPIVDASIKNQLVTAHLNYFIS